MTICHTYSTAFIAPINPVRVSREVLVWASQLVGGLPKHTADQFTLIADMEWARPSKSYCRRSAIDACKLSHAKASVTSYPSCDRQLSGGGCSHQRTCLCRKFPVTGKNTGKM